MSEFSSIVMERLYRRLLEGADTSARLVADARQMEGVPRDKARDCPLVV